MPVTHPDLADGSESCRWFKKTEQLFSTSILRAARLVTATMDQADPANSQ